MSSKVVVVVATITLLLIMGGTFLVSKQNPAPSNEVVARNGVHWHPKLTIYIKGEKQELTDGIGLGAIHQILHTHTEDYKAGVVHIEKQGIVTKNDIKLGRFFQIWGKNFNNNDGSMTMSVNGKENSEFENYIMQDNDVIEIKIL